MLADEVTAMNRSLDRIYAETDKDFRELNVSDLEWTWAKTHHRAFTDRVVEIEETLSYEMGPEQFVDLLLRWQKNIRHLLGLIKKKRTDPFDGVL